MFSSFLMTTTITKHEEHLTWTQTWWWGSEYTDETDANGEENDIVSVFFLLLYLYLRF